MKRKSAGLNTAGLGALVTAIGATFFSAVTWGGIIGFGLAHIVLGLLIASNRHPKVAPPAPGIPVLLLVRIIPGKGPGDSLFSNWRDGSK